MALDEMTESDSDGPLAGGSGPQLFAEWPASDTGYDSAIEVLEALNSEDGLEKSVDTTADAVARRLLYFKQQGRYPPDELLRLLRKLLKETTPPVSAPSLVGLVDQSWAPRELIIQHLLQQQERPLSAIPAGLDIDTSKIHNLPIRIRYDCFAALARGPADPNLYDELNNIATNFGSNPPLDSVDHNFNSVKREAARRVVLAYASGRRGDISDRKAEHCLLAGWSNVVPDLASYTPELAGTPMLETLTERLADGYGRQQLSGTKLVNALIISLERSETISQAKVIQDVILAAFNGNIQPSDRTACWEVVSDMLKDGEHPTATGPVAAGLVTPTIAEDCDIGEFLRFISQGYPSEFSHLDCKNGDEIALPAEHTEALLMALEAIIQGHSGCALELSELKTLATVAVAASHRRFELAISCVSQLAQHSPDRLAESGALDMILQATASAQSAHELEMYGSVLLAAQVYPVPGQVTSHYGSQNEQLDKQAKTLYRQLRAPYRDNHPGPKPSELPTDLREMLGQINIKYRTDRGTWQPLSLSEVDREFISEVASSVASAEDSQVILPYQDPVSFEIAVLGAVTATIACSGVTDETGEAGYVDQVGNLAGLVIYSGGSQYRWGTVKQIKATLKRFGIDIRGGSAASVTPLRDLVTRGSVSSGGEISPNVQTTAVCKDLPIIPVVTSLAKASSLDPEVILYNFIPDIDQGVLRSIRAAGDIPGNSGGTAGIGKAEPKDSRPSAELLNEEQREEITASLPDHAAVEVYGLYTAREGDSSFRGTGPPEELPSPIVAGEEELRSQGATPLSGGGEQGSKVTNPTDLSTTGPNTETVPPDSGTRAARAREVTTSATAVTVHKVRAGGDVRKALNELYQRIDRLDPTVSSHREPYWKLQYLKRDLERLPVPTGFHDSWISSQDIAEKRFKLPTPISKRILDAEGLSGEHPAVAEVISDAVTKLKQLYAALEETNPLTDALRKLLDEVRSRDEHAGILCPKKTYKDILYAYLTNLEGVDQTTIDELVTLLDSETARQLGTHEIGIDRLICFGPGGKDRTPLYTLPVVDRIEILAYDDTWPMFRVERTVEAAFPILPDTTDLSVTLPDITSEILEVSDDAPSTVASGVEETSFEESLLLSFVSEDGGGSSGSSSETPEIHKITYESGLAERYVDTRPVIARTPQQLVSRGEYGLRRVSEISAGDTVVYLPQETLNDLWEEHLAPHYSGNELDWVIDRIRLWYEAIETAIETSYPVDDGRVGPAGAIYKEVGSELPEQRAAVRDWVQAVTEAEGPMDLIFKRELTLGPDNEEAVSVIASEYGGDQFRANASDVFKVMKNIRGQHTREGHEFWKDITQMACTGELFDYPEIIELEVREIQRQS